MFSVLIATSSVPLPRIIRQPQRAMIHTNGWKMDKITEILQRQKMTKRDEIENSFNIFTRFWSLVIAISRNSLKLSTFFRLFCKSVRIISQLFFFSIVFFFNFEKQKHYFLIFSQISLFFCILFQHYWAGKHSIHRMISEFD